MKIIFELLIFGIVTSLSAPLVHGAVAPPADEPPPAFNNVLTDELLVNCPCGYALHRVRSKFDGGDRRWLWECKKVTTTHVNFIGPTYPFLLFRSARK